MSTHPTAEGRQEPVTPAELEAERPPFAMVPESLLDEDVSALAVRLYAVLDRYAGAKARAWPSHAELASRLANKDGRHPSSDTLTRAIHELEHLGYLVVERRRAARAVNRYRLLMRPRRPVPNLGKTWGEQPSTGSRMGAGSRTGAVSGSRMGAARNESHGTRDTGPTGPAQAPVGPEEAAAEPWAFDRAELERARAKVRPPAGEARETRSA